MRVLSVEQSFLKTKYMYLEFVVDGLEIPGHLFFLIIPRLEFPFYLRVVGLNLVCEEMRDLHKMQKKLFIG